MSEKKKDYHKGKKINCYIPDEDYEFHENLIKFWTEYLEVVYSKKAKRRKIA